MGRKKRGSTVMSKPDMTLGNQQALNNCLIKIETKYFNEPASINCNGKRTSSHQPLCQGRECSVIDCSRTELHTNTSFSLVASSIFPERFAQSIASLGICLGSQTVLIFRKKLRFRKILGSNISRCHSRNWSNRNKQQSYTIT